MSWYLIAAVLLLVQAAIAASMQVDLTGAWRAQSSNGSVVVNATVPGVIHTDLLAAGIITEPFAAFNELKQRWVALDNWTYNRHFTSPSTAYSSARIVFEGLDTIANVSLNGHLIGTSNNAFLRWSADVPQDLLRHGENANEITVTFTCAQCYGQAAAAAYPVPLREFRANRFSYSGRPWVRKSQTHFGWNWGPGSTFMQLVKLTRSRLHYPGHLSPCLA